MKGARIRLVGRPAAWGTQTCDYIRLITSAASSNSGDSSQRADRGEWPLGGWSKDELFDKLREARAGLPILRRRPWYITPARARLTRTSPDWMRGAAIRLWRCRAACVPAAPFTPDRVVYTGTHDNDTRLGWWNSDTRKTNAAPFAPTFGERRRHPLGVIRMAQASVASFGGGSATGCAGTGSKPGLNTPSVSEGNFRWRYQQGSLTSCWPRSRRR